MRVAREKDLASPIAPRVLVVEDNMLIAMDLEQILQANGCRIVGRSMSVSDALRYLDDAAIDMAVVDYVLEDGTAQPLANALDAKGIPYAICTGISQDVITSHYPNTPILGKPYSPEDVSIVVNGLVASRGTDSDTAAENSGIGIR